MSSGQAPGHSNCAMQQMTSAHLLRTKGSSVERTVRSESVRVDWRWKTRWFKCVAKWFWQKCLLSIALNGLVKLKPMENGEKVSIKIS